MASGQVADYGQQVLAAEKLLPEKDLCFRVGEDAGGEELFSGAARRYAGKILEIRHISSCGHGSWKRPLGLKEAAHSAILQGQARHGSWKRPLELKGGLARWVMTYQAASWVLEKTP